MPFQYCNVDVFDREGMAVVMLSGELIRNSSLRLIRQKADEVLPNKSSVFGLAVMIDLCQATKADHKGCQGLAYLVDRLTQFRVGHCFWLPYDVRPKLQGWENFPQLTSVPSFPEYQAAEAYLLPKS